MTRSRTIDAERETAPATRAGEPYPLGATYDGRGTNFSVFSRVAERVELCLFDVQRRETRVELPEMTGFTWHGYLPGIGPGHRYGYRVHGPWEPTRGQRCNPSKLLLDPYARAIDGSITWGDAIYGHIPSAPGGATTSTAPPPCPARSSLSDGFDWGDDVRPHVPDNETIIYELTSRA